MKNKLLLIFSLFALCLLIINCKKNHIQAKIMFDKDTVNFSLVQGKSFNTVFKIKNIGDDDLTILNVSGDCACTNIEYPKEPISAGSSAEIKVTYNSGSDEGEVKKIIVVKSNTDPILHTLTLKGVVNKIIGF